MTSDEDIINQYIEALEDQIEDEVSFQDSIHGLRREFFESSLNNISNLIDEYSDRIDFITQLQMGEEICDSIIDIESAVESLADSFDYKERINGIVPNLDRFSDNFCQNIINFLDKKNIDIKEFSNNLSNVNSNKDFKNTLCNIIIELHASDLSSNFNQNTLNNNHLFQFYKKLMSTEIQTDFTNYSINPRNFSCQNLINPNYNYSNKYQESIEVYRKYLHLYKNYNKLDPKDPEYFDLFSQNNLEDIEDFFSKAIHKSQTKLYAKRFLGSYLWLLNEDGIERFSALKEKNTSPEHIRKALCNIAIYDTPEILNLVLDQVINSDVKLLTKFDLELYNCDILYQDSSFLAVKINDFEASSNLGSSRWCISTNLRHFNNYRTENGVQCKDNIFIYDLNRADSDLYQKIGITIKNNGEITNAFNNANRDILNYLLNNKITPTEILNNIINSYTDLLLVKQYNKNNNPTKNDITQVISTISNPVNFIFTHIEDLKNTLVEPFFIQSAITKSLTLSSNIDTIHKSISILSSMNININSNNELINNINNLNGVDKIIIDKIIKPESNVDILTKNIKLKI